MKPILYESTETNFNPNTRNYGLGVLSDAVSCKVVEQLNGSFELSMTYPLSGNHYSDIQLDRIILANSKPRQARAQAFRIYEISRPMDGMVEISAKHISYDMSDYVVQPKFKNDITVDPVTANNVRDAIQAIRDLSYPKNAQGQPVCPFNITSDIVEEGEFSITKPASVRSFLGSDSGSFVDVYGGEWEFDNYECILHAERGEDNGVKILYGVNMTDINQEENIENMYTAIYPYAVHANGSLTYVYRLNPAVPADKAVAPNAPLIKLDGDFSRQKVLPLDVSSNYWQFPSDRIDPTPDDSKRGSTSSGKPTPYQLVNAAMYYIQENKLGEPKVDLNVSFVDLSEVLGLGFFHDVDLGDTVHVYFEKLGVETESRCIKATYNVLLDRYESLELGDATATLADTIANQSTSQAQADEQNLVRYNSLQLAIQEASDAISGNNGGYVVIHDSNDDEYPDEILIMDKPSVREAGVVWRFNKSGWGVSENGYDGEYGMAAYLTDVRDSSGKIIHKKGFVADYITAGTLKSLKIQNGNYDSSTKKYAFEVDEDGNLYANSAVIKGEIIAPYIHSEDYGFEIVSNGYHKKNGTWIYEPSSRITGAKIESKSGNYLLQMESAGLRSYNNSVLLAAFTQDGIDLYAGSNSRLGHFGNTFWTKNNSVKGVAMNLDVGAQFICLGYRNSANDSFTSFLSFNRTANNFSKEVGLHVSNMYTDGNNIYLYGDGGSSGRIYRNANHYIGEMTDGRWYINNGAYLDGYVQVFNGGYMGKPAISMPVSGWGQHAIGFQWSGSRLGVWVDNSHVGYMNLSW